MVSTTLRENIGTFQIFSLDPNIRRYYNDYLVQNLRDIGGSGRDRRADHFQSDHDHEVNVAQDFGNFYLMK